MKVVVGARKSPLSQAQVREVEAEFGFQFQTIWVETAGDRDQAISLRSLGKSDLFTRELDQMLLDGTIRLAIHSAKDLPDPIPAGLAIAVLTKGVDPRDSLVLRQRRLPEAPLIATSSERREEAVRKIFPKARFEDIRGTIGARLEKLERGAVDGVVIAEAALIRLKLTHLNRLVLEGETVEGQGRLAVVCRANDREMLERLCIASST